MKSRLIIAFILALKCGATLAQHNWAPVPCFQLNNSADAIGRMFMDSAHHELVLVPFYSTKICNRTFKGLFAYNGNSFHDLDFGIESHDPDPNVNSVLITDLAEYDHKAIFTGGFLSVGSQTLYAKTIAQWDGSAWKTFPHPFWDNKPSWSSGGGFTKLLKQDEKLWMFAGFDTTGSNYTSKIVLYDGLTFASVPPLPVSNHSSITEAILYKNKLIVSGNFYNAPSYDYYRLAQFDGTTWSQVGSGVRGSLSGCHSLAIYNDTLYIAGSFSKSDGNPGNYIMKWDGSQLQDAGFGGFCGYANVWKLLTYKNRLYAFGSFPCAANQKAFGIAYYEKGIWTVPQDSIENHGIMDAAVYNDAIYVGGSFKSINGDTTLRQFVKLTCPNFDAANGCISGLKEASFPLNASVFPNPCKDKIQLQFEHSISINKVTLVNALGKEVLRLFNPTPGQSINISDFPAGIYVLKAENRQGQRTFKVVKD